MGSMGIHGFVAILLLNQTKSILGIYTVYIIMWWFTVSPYFWIIFILKYFTASTHCIYVWIQLTLKVTDNGLTKYEQRLSLSGTLMVKAFAKRQGFYSYLNMIWQTIHARLSIM